MSQQTMHPGAPAVAEPPAPFLPDNDTEGADNRRKLILVGAGVGVLVLAIVAFFLLKGGSSSSGSASGLVPKGHPKAAAAGGKAAAAAPSVTLPKKISTPVGRNPFTSLLPSPAPSAAPSSAPSTGTTGTTTGTTSGSGTGTGTSTAPVYKPVWIMLKAITASTATFDVGYSNGKTLRAVRFSGIKAPKSGGETVFAQTFALLGVSNGTAVVKFGDGTAFRLDMQHNYMVVD